MKKTVAPSYLDGFSYRSNELFCEGVSLSHLASEIGTPLYVYSKTALVNRARRLFAALQGGASAPECRILFAVKACSNIHILNTLRAAGCGADIVSGGELFRATLAQIAPSSIVFSGIGKSKRELSEALAAEISMFNVESPQELFELDQLAASLGAKPRVSLRVNPNVDAKTHPHISTGLKQNKFGLSKDELKEIYRKLNSLRAAQVCGLSCHIGSQILTEAPFVKAWKELRAIAEAAPFEVTHLDLGGGLGIPYGSEKTLSLESYGRLIRGIFKNSPYQLSIEPGRALVGPTGVLLTKLEIIKSRGTKHFYVVDAAMNDLIRPALYGATHPVLPVLTKKSQKKVTVDLVGPVCESSDTFQKNLRLPSLAPNELLAFCNAGAYGMTMASQYNSRPRAAEVLVEGTNYKIIRSREKYADLIQHELV
jgi:diaminopimelate decarboxylase